MAKTTAKTLRRIRDCLTEGNFRAAWVDIEPILTFPESQMATPDELAAAWAYFEQVCSSIGQEELAPLVRAARSTDAKSDSLTDLGLALIDADLRPLAATALTRARELSTPSALTVELDAAIELALS